MNFNFLLTFLLLSIVNVIFSTARSILTIKGGKLLASLMSGGYFAFYNIMLIYTVADFPMWQKCVITFVSNVIGVYIVKYFEDKFKKERLWKIEVTVKTAYTDTMKKMLESTEIGYNCIELEKWSVFNIFCENQSESKLVGEMVKKCNAKYFISENRGVL